MSRLLLAAFLAAALNQAASAQLKAKVAGDAPSPPAAARAEFAAGFSSWNPNGSLAGISFQGINAGSIYSGSYFFTRSLGAEFEAGLHPETVNDGDQSFSAGPVFRFPASKATPFVHVLVGGTRLTGPNVPSLGGTGYFYNGCAWGAAITVGGGVDLTIPQLHGRFALRIVQADYQFHHVPFGPLTATGGGTATLNVVRVSTGLVLRLGKM